MNCQLKSYKENLPQNVKIGIIALAKRCNTDKVILFGSRARGDNSPQSDVDIAISGGNTVEFACSIDDDIETLLMFDVVDLDGVVQKELREIINKEGVTIYEKI